MKAAVYYDKGDIRYEEVALPMIGPDEILLKVKACGLCGTDIHKALDRLVSPGTVLGHEIAGEIVEVGREVKGYAAGDRIYAAHHVPCFTCHHCRRGAYSLCPQFKRTNVEPGGFAEYIRIPALHVQHTIGKLPAQVSDEQGAMVEPVACCLHGFEKIDFRPGASVLIMGAGQIGCIQIQLARHFLASQIIVSDLNPFRLQKALEFGADYAVNSATHDLETEVMEITAGAGVDVVIISAGVDALLPQAINVLNRGGTVLVFAPFSGRQVSIPAARFFQDEVKIVGAYSSNPYHYPTALQLLSSRIVDAEKMITHRFSLAELPTAIACAHHPSGQVIKVMIKPEQEEGNAVGTVSAGE
ncbi:zinc-binding dehydrogenase [Brevibacillus fulvus]|uniref:L-iditol 2-dehydrogenase n=1 Tax=Brevibacillus fulvus TaxID=1125967 RepID=A0A938Y1P9_9BACL|nr:L-iditol 2-dehydrogenase [Brevibacillus fulvus]